MAKIKEQPKAKNIKDARKWFLEATEELQMGGKVKGKIPALADLRGMAGQMIGKLMYFRYSPATGRELPYYDIFPLIIIVKEYDKYVKGLNLHYLPPEQRVELMTNLFNIITNVKFDSDTRFRLTYRYLQSLKQLRFFRPCIKSYRYSNIVTIPRVVKPAYWYRAIMLENAIWKKAAPAKIWQDSRRTWLKYA